MDSYNGEDALKEYYENLIAHYEPWFKDYDASEKMVINGNRYDFVNNMDDRRCVLNAIDDKLLELGKISKEEYTSLQEKISQL